MACLRAVSVLLILLCLASSTNVLVFASPARIRSGDWIRYDNINTGMVPFTSETVLTKVEFLKVLSPTAMILVTENRTDGTAQIRTRNLNLNSDWNYSNGYSGFAIPTDLKVGGIFRLSGWGNVTITGQTTRTYAGVTRTVIYAPYSESAETDNPAVETISYWDKQT